MRQEMWLDRAVIIAECSGAGLSVKETAKLTGLCELTVRKYIARFEISFVGKLEKAPRKSRIDQNIETVRRCASDGKTRQQTAEEVGLSYHTVVIYAQKYDIEFAHASLGNGVDASRAEVMASMYVSGKTLREIGDTYGLTRERVRQIIKKEHGLAATDGGQHTKAERRRVSVAAAKDRDSYKRHGCSYEQYRGILELGRIMMAEGANFCRTPSGAWHSQKRNAIKRGIDFNISLSDWWDVWTQSGKWDIRGRSKGEYVMCRFGDAGAYEVGNVYIATNVHNGTVQPNNPYRKGHPQHEEAMMVVRRARMAVPRVNHRPKHNGLPLGVTMNKGRFQAQAAIMGENKYIGSFGTPEEAHAAYLDKLAQLGISVASTPAQLDGVLQ